jgi:DeoR family ulaG and ulaABCDEF operon transcriptional repressor
VIEGDPLIARAEAKLLRRADRLIVMVDSSKFDMRGSIAVCPLSRVHTIITDESAPKASLDLLRTAGIEILVAANAQNRREASTAA